MEPMNWNCPYCGRAQVVTKETFDRIEVTIDNSLSKHGPIGGRITTIVCSNKDCREVSLGFALHKTVTLGGDYRRQFATPALHAWPLLPESSAKPQPDYIPEPILENYKQACRIRDLSPNASATMSRRCLQGMIRNFCKITKLTLAKEIGHLKELLDGGNGPLGVSHDTMDAIDHTRQLGNIGAHMEEDINLILDVEPTEAQALIGLIELLFEEWYVAKHERESKLKKLGVIVDKKNAKKEEAKLSSSAETPSAPKSDRG